MGLHGAVLQMFSHGIIAGLLFAVVGRMVYDRTHTRDLEELSGLKLSRVLPFAAVCFVVGGLASMGLPGFSGFVAELQVLIGAWHAFPRFALGAGLGMVLGVAYILRALQKAFFGEGRIEASPAARADEPITLPERVGAVILMVTTTVIGLYPKLLLDVIGPSVDQVLQGLRQGGAW
jgi:NADH-quinone oxidoreductase subunit M